MNPDRSEYSGWKVLGFNCEFLDLVRRLSMSWWSWPPTCKLQTSSPGLLQAASCRLLQSRWSNCRSRPGRCWTKPGWTLSSTRLLAISRKYPGPLIMSTRTGKIQTQSSSAWSHQRYDNLDIAEWARVLIFHLRSGAQLLLSFVVATGWSLTRAGLHWKTAKKGRMKCWWSTRF